MFFHVLRQPALWVGCLFVLALTGCQNDVDGPRDQDSVVSPQANQAAITPEKIMIFGTVTSVQDGDLLVTLPRPVDPAQAGTELWSEALPGRGLGDRPLRVTADPGVVVEHRDGTWADLQAGSPVMIAGDLTAAGLNARYVLDPRNLAIDAGSVTKRQPAGAWTPGPPLTFPAGALPRFDAAADLPATESDASTENFPGAFGGPSWSFDTGDDDLEIMVVDGLLVWVYLNRIRPTVGLGGGHYDFPFTFSADAPSTLVVGQPGEVSLQVDPQSPEGGAYSYFWALGVNIDMRFSICAPIVGCEDFDYDLSLLSVVSATDDSAPLEGEELDIPHHACPEIPVIAIPDTPITVLGIGLCQDQTLVGKPFHADIQAQGFLGGRDFNHPAQNVSTLPFTNPLTIGLDAFSYEPDFAMGVSLSINVMTIPVYDTPGIDLAQGPMSFIPTASASCGSFFEVDTCGDEQPAEVSLVLPTIPVVTWVEAWPNPARFGDNITIEALVRGANGPGDSPREVAFYDGDVHLATMPIAGDDRARLEIATLDPCRHVISARYVGIDRDGVTYPSEKSVVLIVTGDGDVTYPEGYWQHEYSRHGRCDFDEDTLECYLAMVAELSSVFSEARDIPTLAAAHDVLFLGGNRGSELDQLDRELLVTWLNFADGAFGYHEMVATGLDDTPELPFDQVMSRVETVRLDPAATLRQIRAATRILHNLKDVQAPFTDRVRLGEF